jgi:hypothetical protein
LPALAIKSMLFSFLFNPPIFEVVFGVCNLLLLIRVIPVVKQIKNER